MNIINNKISTIAVLSLVVLGSGFATNSNAMTANADRGVGTANFCIKSSNTEHANTAMRGGELCTSSQPAPCEINENFDNINERYREAIQDLMTPDSSTYTSIANLPDANFGSERISVQAGNIMSVDFDDIDVSCDSTPDEVTQQLIDNTSMTYSYDVGVRLMTENATYTSTATMSVDSFEATHTPLPTSYIEIANMFIGSGWTADASQDATAQHYSEQIQPNFEAELQSKIVELLA